MKKKYLMGAAYRKAKGIPQITFTCTPQQKEIIDHKVTKAKMTRQQWILKTLLSAKE